MPNKGQILLIESQRMVREVLRDKLVMIGFNVWEAADVRQGLHLLHEGCKPDVIISDIVAPSAAGVEAFSLIRFLYPSIKILAVTGGYKNAQNILDPAFEADADAVLQKPFNMQQLQSTVYQLIR